MTNKNERTADQSRQEAISAMGEPLGDLYSALWQQLVSLYQKWGEYVALFGTNEERITLLNKTGPKFFRIVQDCLWEDTLLHLSRLTDSPRIAGKDNLSIRQLSKLIGNPKHRTEMEDIVQSAIEATGFARDWRNRRIAHRDLSLALNKPTEPLAFASRQHVTQALTALSKVLNFISQTHMGSTTMFDFAAKPGSGGASTTLSYLHAGLEAESERRLRLKSGTFNPKDINHSNI